MGQALYRTYRSKTLADMVGQEHVTEALANAIKNGRISHAYLFTGPRGVGKTSAARILAHEINKLPYDDSQHLDIIEIDAASNRRIDDIRDLRDKVHIAPANATYKVYIIDEVHMLTGESFNALLKTLEEPPEHVVFILATTEVHKLPATIVSRTQRFNFRLVDLPKVVKHLRFIADKEKIKVDDDALQLIAEHGEGSFRDSINLLDQLANVNGGKIDSISVERCLGVASKQAVTAIISAAAKGDFETVNQQLNELEAQGVNSAALLPQLNRALQDQAVKDPSLYRLLDQLIDIPRSYNPKLKLRTALVQFSLRDDQPSTTAKPAQHKTAPAATKAILHVEKPTPPKRKSTPASAEPQQAEGNKLDGISEQQWGSVLAKVKQESAPLYGILRQGEPSFDASTQTLTLKFRYLLHRKRIDDAKPKKIIATIMLELLGGSPIILTELDTSPAASPEVELPAPAPEEPATPTDDSAKSVIEMMGGGEVIDA